MTDLVAPSVRAAFRRLVDMIFPPQALDGGADGLAAFSGLAELLPGLLKPGGHSLLEIGMGQESALGTLFKGLELLRIAPDLAGVPRCVILRKP